MRFCNMFLLLSVLATVLYMQHNYTQGRYGTLALLEECTWCEDNDELKDDLLYLPLNSKYIGGLFPANFDFLADLLWIRTSYYFGKQALFDGEYLHLFDLLNVITDFAPEWELPYYFAAICLPLEVDDVDGGLFFIEKGLSQFPDNWQLWFFKGYYLWREKQDVVGGAKSIAKASSLPGAPNFLASLSVTIASKSGQIELRERFFQEAFNTMRDSKQKEIILKAIESN